MPEQIQIHRERPAKKRAEYLANNAKVWPTFH
jgi:hypothetical protein